MAEGARGWLAVGLAAALTITLLGETLAIACGPEMPEQSPSSESTPKPMNTRNAALFFIGLVTVAVLLGAAIIALSLIGT